MFLLSRLTHRGDLRSAGISRFFATPLRLTGPHHSRRGPLLPSFYIGQDTRVLADDSPRAPGSSLAWLLACRWAARCCLRPRGVGSVLVGIALTTWPAPYWKGSAHSQTEVVLGAMCQIQGYTLHLAALVYLPFRLAPSVIKLLGG